MPSSNRGNDRIAKEISLYTSAGLALKTTPTAKIFEISKVLSKTRKTMKTWHQGQSRDTEAGLPAL